MIEEGSFLPIGASKSWAAIKRAAKSAKGAASAKFTHTVQKGADKLDKHKEKTKEKERARQEKRLTELAEKEKGKKLGGNLWGSDNNVVSSSTTMTSASSSFKSAHASSLEDYEKQRLEVVQDDNYLAKWWASSSAQFQKPTKKVVKKSAAAASATSMDETDKELVSYTKLKYGSPTVVVAEPVEIISVNPSDDDIVVTTPGIFEIRKGFWQILKIR